MTGSGLEDIRVAVAGAGHWGRNLVRNFAGIGALEAICDRDRGTLGSFSGLYPDVRLVTEYETLLADDTLDAIVLATPAESHYAMAKRFLEAGKDVFVEKPLALTSGQGEELAALARSGGRVLMVGHLLHYHPAVRIIRELVDTGELGELYYMSSNRLNLGRVRREENVLWSFAPHDVSVMLMLAGHPESVTATGGAYLQPDIYDTTITSLAFAGGVRGHIYVSWLHPYKDHRMVVIGSSRMLVFDDLENEEKIRLYDKGVDLDDITAIRSNGYSVVPFEPAEPLRRECEHFLECVAGRMNPETDGEKGVDVLRVLEAAQRSMDGGGVTAAVPRGTQRTGTN